MPSASKWVKQRTISSANLVSTRGLGGGKMLAVGVSHVQMQSSATWATASLPYVFISSRSIALNAGRHHLNGKWLQFPALKLWRSPLAPSGSSLRVSGTGVDGNTTDVSLSWDAGEVRSQSSASTVEGDEAAGSTEHELSVFSKFVDEQLLQILNKETANPVRQTVLMTDGTDTRPYRLLWPSPSLIFAVSPVTAFHATSRLQIEKGLQAPRSCLVQHISVDVVNEDWGDHFIDSLLRKGYKGDAPSVWIIEMPRATLSEFSLRGLLTIASSLLMKGSTFVGVLSSPRAGLSELETRGLLEKLFVGQGFTLKVLSYEELTSKSPLESRPVPRAHPQNLLFAFVAQQQRLSDAQVEYAQMQIALAEEVEEDGFEDSW